MIHYLLQLSKQDQAEPYFLVMRSLLTIACFLVRFQACNNSSKASRIIGEEERYSRTGERKEGRTDEEGRPAAQTATKFEFIRSITVSQSYRLIPNMSTKSELAILS